MTDESAVTVREARLRGRRHLARAGIAQPELDADLILAHTLNTERTRLALDDERRLDAALWRCFWANIERRAGGECVAYITGRKSFRFLELAVNHHVLVPRPDTETLVEAAGCFLAGDARRCALLDLCTGSGAVALALLDEHPRLAVTLQDISADALAVARRNYEALRSGTATGAARQFEHPANFVQGDLFEGIARRFDVITANPPYIARDDLSSLPREVRGEPKLALDGGSDGLAVIRRIIDGAPSRLVCGGALLLEAAPPQMPAIAALLTAAGFEEITLHRDLAAQYRVICARFL